MAETAIYLDLTHLSQRLLVFENGMHYSSLILAKIPMLKFKSYLLR